MGTRSGPTLKRHRSDQAVATPWSFIHAVQQKFGPLTIDLAATYLNKKAPLYISPETNSLSVSWADHIGAGLGWLNPPFANIAPWAAKCVIEMQQGSEILLLVPMGSQNWYWEYVEPFAQVYAVGRMTFEGSSDPYIKDLILAHYDPRWADLSLLPKMSRWQWQKEVG